MTLKANFSRLSSVLLCFMLMQGSSSLPAQKTNGEPIIANVQSKLFEMKTEKLIQAGQLLDSFHPKKSIDDLENAIKALSAASETFEIPAARRSALRKKIAIEWLRVFSTIDQNLDLSYDETDPKNRVFLNITPSRGGYSSGTNPKDIKEPELRAEYEAQIEENNRRLVRLKFQRKLRQLDDYARTSVSKRFLFEMSPEAAFLQGKEWVEAVSHSALSPARKEQLRALSEQK